jgi:hypothetical protein
LIPEAAQAGNATAIAASSMNRGDHRLATERHLELIDTIEVLKVVFDAYVLCCNSIAYL